MKSIRFSHIYTKMPEQREGTELMEVFVTKTEDLHKSFTEYDTSYWQYDFLEKKSILKHYPLPGGKILVLLLFTPPKAFGKGHVWTTIRRWTLQKEIYYKGLRGQKIEIKTGRIREDTS